MGRNRPESLSIVAARQPQFRAADLMRLVQDRVEYRRGVTGRGIDDAEDLPEGRP